ncbi:adenosylcobinamide amidohydrolase [uncultured Veillonella sp.]|uniref:adenosylcobinamide amidohydrolase n=1 Tax=uncultured Veillonella sp. TaxID=159268 RepID=UPI0026307C9F|nr:adenosylcobinamide amidohydrolase [uncultured Veillonella sp.]
MTKQQHVNPYAAPSQLDVGGYVTTTASALTVAFDEVHYSLSTSPLNGGFHHTLALRNQQLNFFVNNEQELPGGSMASYLSLEFEQEDYPLNFCTGLITSASMKWHAYAKVTCDTLLVEVIATAGYEETAHRAGDGYHYVEQEGHFTQPHTINLLVFTNHALTDGAMTKALITITEAKTVALQEAQIYDATGQHLASGTATDGVILTIDTNGPILTDAGTFSQFGDTLAKAVRLAIKRALENGRTRKVLEEGNA